ncbi:peptidylprolyl isomerase [Deinococcus budaensis]|uniref:Peptidyl-prolyl cis-trans isomerase n=1 Tax=Deinococcus budaensis TaxID=1665626 RepID=A0A7W8GG54_9DEIO|nr:peptidylprolyl isomerase [Deinococcus budaensis]MBB5234608.1 peptidylprolyl isomerase [Deinococcus budaensis]
MKRALLMLTALLTLTACQDRNAASTDAETPAQSQTDTPEAQAPETETPATETPDAATQETATGETPAGETAATTQPGAVPSGYTLVAPLGAQPVREFGAAPAPALEEGKDYYALIDTNRGQILADLYEEETPVTVNNFVTLARNRYFDGLRFHRVIEGFMAQTGDPLSADESKKDAWGTGGPGYSFADEFRTSLTFDAPGVLAMANSGPATNGSQFFITLAPTDFLNGRHTIFGKVVQGQDVLAKLTRTSDTSSGQEVPIEGATPDRMLSVRILTKG